MNRGALWAVMIAISAGGCAIVPSQPTRPVAPSGERLTDAHFAVEALQLTTIGGLPAVGSEGHERLRGFLAEQLNAAAGADAGARQVLPTRVTLARVAPIFSSREALKVAMTTELVDGTSVETTDKIEGRARVSGSGPYGPFVPSLGACSPCGALPLLAMGNPLAGVLVVVALVAVIVVVALVAALPFAIYSAVQADHERTVAYSNGIQRVAIAHARAVRQAMAATNAEPPLP